MIGACDTDHSSFYEDSDCDSERNCLDWMEYSDSRTGDCSDYIQHVESHAKDYAHEANIRRVRGRNKKLLEEAASGVTKEVVEEEKI